ncbi:hypothetical protein ACK3F5_11550 [Photorhabdus asymbiotica UENP]
MTEYIPNRFRTAAASERIPRRMDNSVTGGSESSQQSSNLKDEGYSYSSN